MVTGSSRPRLRSEISRGHSHDDPNDSTSARTRPFSYDEIMRRRKSKKQLDVSKEEGRETDHARNEDSVKNFDRHGRDANDADSREKEDKSSRMEGTHNRRKNDESRDSQSKHDYEKDLTYVNEAVKTNRREHVHGTLDEGDRDMEFRSKQKDDRYGKNGTEESQYDRRYVTREAHEENHDLNSLSKGKHDNSVKNRAPSLKVDRRGNVRDKMDEEIQGMDSRSKHEHEKYLKNNIHESITGRRGYESGRRDEENRDMNALSKDKHDDRVKNRSSLLNTDRRGNVRDKMHEDNRYMDSRSNQEHTKYVKNDTQVLITDRRGYQSGRRDEESYDMNARSKDRHENFMKNSIPLLKPDRRGNVGDKMYEKNQDIFTKYKNEHNRYAGRNDPQVPIIDRRGYKSGRRDEDIYEMNDRSKDKDEKILKNSTPSLNADRRGNVRDKEDGDGRHEKDMRNSAEELKNNRQGHVRNNQGEVSRVDAKYENDNSTPSLNADRRGNIRDKEDGEGHDVDIRSKNKHEKDLRNSAEGLKNNRQGHVRNNQGEDSRVDAKYENENKLHKDYVAQNRYVERSRELSESEKKRKDRTIDDEKYRHKDSLKKHDSGHRVDDEKYTRKDSLKKHDSGHRIDDEKYRPKDSLKKHDSGHRIDDEKYRPKDSLTKHDSGHRIDDEKYRPKDSLIKHDSGHRIDDEKYRPRDSLRKRDSGHRMGSDISERKEKSEITHLSHVESRSKRRRSRSPDRSKEKNRRSRSASPKVRKSTLSREQDHDPLSLQSQKEESKDKYDVDRSNTASNGTISHHRQNSGFSSGLGGYSPRKRKTDAAIKTPSPIRSPERKSAGRDLPLSGVDVNLTASVASGSQPMSHIMSTNKIGLALGTSVASSMGIPLSTTFFHGFSTFKEASVDSVQLTQATRPMRRLYIDNIPASASEKEIMESFNTYLLSSGSNHIRGTRPCLSCMINKEKGQALLEFLTPEDASAALSFDGRSLYGSVLKIRRPKDYVEITSGSVERLKARAVKENAVSDVAATDVAKDVAISDIVKDSPHKIFVGGIAEGLSSEMVMEIFSVMGPLKAFRFNTNENGNEPCVFLEYTDQSITLKACAALNGMKLGGRILTVAQAIPDTASKVNLGSQPFYGVPEHIKPLLEKPTLVLKLSNVVDQKAMELLPETDLEEILEDVRLECSRFGCVVSINAVKTSNIHTTDSNVKDVINAEMHVEPRDESESRESHDHHLNMDLEQAAMKHDEIDGDDNNHVTNVEEINTVGNLDDGKLDSAAPAIKVENSKMSSLDVEDTVVSAVNEEATNRPQESFDPENMNNSDGNHTESIQESEVSSLSDPIENTGIVKLGDFETSLTADVDQLDKASGQLQEIASVSNNSATNNQVIETPNLRNMFEVGCILVEFKRTEASSMAAHRLHGRLFDDRIVAVEYVPLESYQAMFPK